MDDSWLSHLTFAGMALLFLVLWVWPWWRLIQRFWWHHKPVKGWFLTWAMAGFFLTCFTAFYFLNPEVWLTDFSTVMARAGWIPVLLTLVFSGLCIRKQRHLLQSSPPK